MKPTILKSVMSVLVALFSLSAYAYDVEYNGIYYDLDRETMTASVTYKVKYSSSYSGVVNIPETCTYKQKTYRVTSIGEYAFYNCSGLTTVTIPNSVTSIGSDAFYDCRSLSAVSIPNSVTSIGGYAFSNCCGLTSMDIPNSITSIDTHAFYHCSGLTAVNIPCSVQFIWEYAFSGCSGLTTVSIPNSVTSIGYYAFEGCCSLTHVDIPNSISSVSSSPFYNCNNIKNVYCFLQDVNILNSVFKDVSVSNTTLHVQKALIDNFYEYSNFDNVVALDVNIDGIYYYIDPENLTAEVLHGDYTGNIAIPTSVEYEGNTYAVTSISYGVFKGCSGLTSVSIPNSVIFPIEDRAFSGCSALTSVSIGNGVTSIGKEVFSGCSALTSVSIGNGVTSIGEKAFYGCSGLSSVSIPNSVTSIGKEAFRGCSRLSSISIPNSVTSIGWFAFYGCSGLSSVSIPNSVTFIDNSTFGGCSGLTSVDIPNSVTYINNYAFMDCNRLTTVNIPNSVTFIGIRAFYGCRGLSSVSIPNSVTRISDYAFEGCSALTSVSIGNGVIGQYAFSSCSALTSVGIGNGVTSIDYGAFSNCSRLTDVYCYAKNLPSTETTAFQRFNISNAILHVPEESLETYKSTSPWSGFGTFVSIEDNKVLYKMTINVSDLRGTVTYSETNITNRKETFDVKEGSDVVLMLTPRDGCKVKSVKVNGIEKVAEVNGGGELTIANVEGNLSVEVEFECAGDYMTATIGSNGFATFCSMEALDFSEVEDVRAYTVSTYQPKTGEVTLTRVYEVPAGMGLVLIGKEGEYEIPLGTGEAMVSNLLVGINENTTLKATENDRTNFILPEDQEKAAFCAVTDEVELPFSKAYLPLPTESVAHLKDGKLTLHLADPSLGDVDGDGYVNISDVTTLVNIILGK